MSRLMEPGEHHTVGVAAHCAAHQMTHQQGHPVGCRLWGSPGARRAPRVARHVADEARRHVVAQLTFRMMRPVCPAHHVRGHMTPSATRWATRRAGSRRVRHAARKRRHRVTQLVDGRAIYKPVRLLVHRREPIAVHHLASWQARHVRRRLVKRSAGQPGQRLGHSHARHATPAHVAPARCYVAQQVVHTSEESSCREGHMSQQGGQGP